MAKHKAHTPRWIILLIDVIICIIALATAYFLLFNITETSSRPFSLLTMMLIIIPVQALTFVIFKTYSNLIRYTSLKDAERIFMVISTATLFILILNIVWNRIHPKQSEHIIPYTLIFLDYLLCAVMLIGSRMVYKSLYYAISNSTIPKENTLILGNEQFATAVKRAIDKDTISSIHVVAFVDPTGMQSGQKIEGIKIYSLDKFESLLNKQNIGRVILAQTDFNVEQKNTIVDTCLNHKINVQSIPDINSWLNGELTTRQIRNIRIEELLEREPIKLNIDRIHSYTRGKVVLVTGAAGSIGSEMVRQLSKFGPKLIVLFDQAESPLYNLELELHEKLGFFDFQTVIGSMCNEYRVRKLFSVFHPEVVFHAAAYKHVPMMEENPTEAISNNIRGTKIMADLAVEYGVKKFVMVSSDKAVNPTNVMGASKRIAEIYTQTLNKVSNTKFITTRFGNVLGSNGSVIPRFKMQIDQGGPITITHPEITRFFMTIPEACQLVLEAGSIGEGGEIMVFDMGKSVKIVDLAKKMVELSGLEIGKDIQIRYTGLRPGEKLFEELLNSKENCMETHHPKILIAKVRSYEPHEIFKKIDELLAELPKHNNFTLVGKMKEIIPEFISQNSMYEGLDKQNQYNKSDEHKELQNTQTA